MTHKCEKCGHVNRSGPKDTRKLCLAYSLTALILYFPANFFPFMTMELYGKSSTSTIWGGVKSLADSGSWAIAVIIFLASIVIPLVKLLILFFLSLTPADDGRSALKTRLYYFVEAIGRWSMLDIFLLAVLVAIMKLGHFTHVEPELGSLLFAFVVIFTMLASAVFNPALLWGEEDHV